jgi:hypothetical protein
LLALCFHRLSFPVALHLVSLARSIFFTCHQCCLLTFPACSPVAEACSLAAFFFFSVQLNAPYVSVGECPLACSISLPVYGSKIRKSGHFYCLSSSLVLMYSVCAHRTPSCYLS